MAGIYSVEDVTASLTERCSHSSSPHLFLSAVFISLILHFVVMALYKPEPTNLTQPLQSPLRISLIPVKKIVEPVKPVLPSIPPAKLQTIPDSELKPDLPLQPNPVIDSSPPQEDLQTTIRRSSVIPDHYRLTQEDLARPSVKPANVDTVFNPHLREKLRAAESKRTETASTSMEVTTIHGETVVMLDEGRCMSSDARRDSLTRAADWYFTHCNKSKTEGELMMDRVNQRTFRRSD